MDGYRGIAFYLDRYATREVENSYLEEDDQGEFWSYETETVEDRDMVVAIMVGDDRKHTAREIPIPVGPFPHKSN